MYVSFMEILTVFLFFLFENNDNLLFFFRIFALSINNALFI